MHICYILFACGYIISLLKKSSNIFGDQEFWKLLFVHKAAELLFFL